MALNSNILLSGIDHIQSATVLSSPSNTVVNFPYANFQTERMFEFGRFWSSSQSQTWISYDFGSSKGIDLVATLKHNMGQLALWRVRLSNDPTFATTVYDSGWAYVTPPSTGESGLAWGQFDWGGLSPLSFTSQFNRHAYMPLPDTVSARYIRFDFDDEAEASSRKDSFVQIARLWAGPGYQPTINVDYGAKNTAADRTGEKIARSGARQYDERDVRVRSLQLAFADLPHKELLYNIYGPLFMRNGKRKPLIAILFPQDPETFLMEAVYGNLKDVEAAEHVYWRHMQTSMTIEESV